MTNTQLKDPNIEKDITINSPNLSTPKYNLLIAQTLAKTRHNHNQNGKKNTTNSNKSIKILSIENTIKKAQEKYIKEGKKEFI